MLFSNSIIAIAYDVINKEPYAKTNTILTQKGRNILETREHAREGNDNCRIQWNALLP